MKYSQEIHHFQLLLGQNELRFPGEIPTACGQVYNV
jgi:hypothetical protein